MSVSSIPGPIKQLLWVRSGGRCEFEGCNEPLWHDIITKKNYNAAYIAHIIADQPGGPRGDTVLSLKKCKDVDNLMLLCDRHHTLIDTTENIADYSVDRLTAMKKVHEDRIALLTSLRDKTTSHVITYFPKTGAHSLNIHPDAANGTILPEFLPADKMPIELHTLNSAFGDHENQFWNIEREQLKRKYSDCVKRHITSGHIRHLSVFALAPQPLLIELGALISDIQPAVVYQKHREPDTWRWTEGPDNFSYRVIEPERQQTNLALNISLSGTITNDRIFSVLGDDTSIWTLTIDNPNNDFVKSQEQVSQFREIMRSLFNRIKEVHGQNATLHVFPACPASLAVELGRVWMSKADLSMSLFDQSKTHDRFIHAFDINSSIENLDSNNPVYSALIG